MSAWVRCPRRVDPSLEYSEETGPTKPMNAPVVRGNGRQSHTSEGEVSAAEVGDSTLAFDEAAVGAVDADLMSWFDRKPFAYVHRLGAYRTSLESVLRAVRRVPVPSVTDWDDVPCPFARPSEFSATKCVAGSAGLLAHVQRRMVPRDGGTGPSDFILEDCRVWDHLH